MCPSYTVAEAIDVPRQPGIPISVVGYVLIEPDGTGWYCETLTDSAPPQCAGERLEFEALDFLGAAGPDEGFPRAGRGAMVGRGSTPRRSDALASAHKSIGAAAKPGSPPTVLDGREGASGQRRPLRVPLTVGIEVMLVPVVARRSSPYIFSRSTIG